MKSAEKDVSKKRIIGNSIGNVTNEQNLGIPMRERMDREATPSERVRPARSRRLGLDSLRYEPG